MFPGLFLGYRRHRAQGLQSQCLPAQTGGTGLRNTTALSDFSQLHVPTDAPTIHRERDAPSLWTSTQAPEAYQELGESYY